MSKQPTVHLLPPVERAGGPVYLVKWREPGGAQVKKRVGPAWVERGEVPPGHRRATRHPGWIKRRGRALEGYFTEDSAIASAQAVIQQAREERARQAGAPDPSLVVTFDDVASAWLEHRRTVGGCKRTTLIGYAAMLRKPGDAARKRGRAPAARIMSAFGGRTAASITKREVSRWLSELDRNPALSARAVNLHRSVMHSVFAFGCRDDTFGLPMNPIVGTEKRREPDPAEIVTYTPSEVIAMIVRRTANAAAWCRASARDSSVYASSSNPTCQVARNATLAQSAKRERRMSAPSQSFVPILMYRIGWW
jgi:hypothetical protein